MKKIKNIHPGEILKEEFLNEFHITAYKLAKDTDIPPTRISQIIKGKRSVSTDTALRFSKYFRTILFLDKLTSCQPFLLER